MITPNLDQLREHVTKLKALLDDPHPGLDSWTQMFDEHVLAISLFKRNEGPVFKLDKDQRKKLADWLATRVPGYRGSLGAIGGRYSYTFCCTTLGTVIKVRDDVTKEEIDLSDYENW